MCGSVRVVVCAGLCVVVYVQVCACGFVCSSLCVVVCAVLCVWLCEARIQSGLPFPSPEDLPNLGIKPRSLALQANSLLSEPPRKQSFNKLPFYFAGFLCCVEAFKFDEVPLVHFCFCCFGVRFLKNH